MPAVGAAPPARLYAIALGQRDEGQRAMYRQKAQPLPNGQQHVRKSRSSACKPPAATTVARAGPRARRCRSVRVSSKRYATDTGTIGGNHKNTTQKTWPRANQVNQLVLGPPTYSVFITTTQNYPSKMWRVASRMAIYSSTGVCGSIDATNSSRSARSAAVQSGSRSQADAGSTSSAPWYAVM